jgi:hypothetical protein
LLFNQEGQTALQNFGGPPAKRRRVSSSSLVPDQVRQLGFRVLCNAVCDADVETIELPLDEAIYRAAHAISGQQSALVVRSEIDRAVALLQQRRDELVLQVQTLSGFAASFAKKLRDLLVPGVSGCSSVMHHPVAAAGHHLNLDLEYIKAVAPGIDIAKRFLSARPDPPNARQVVREAWEARHSGLRAAEAPRKPPQRPR